MGTLSDFDLDDEMGLLPWAVAFMDVGVRVRQFLDRDGRPGARRLRAFLAQQDGAGEEPVPEGPAEPPEPPPAVSPPSRGVAYPPTDRPYGPVRLSREDIARLKAHTSRYAGIHRLFEMAAERSPEWVWKQEVEGDLGMTATHLRNQLRSLTWLMRELFGTEGSEHWPINVIRWGGLYFYRLDPTTAQWWREAE